MKEMVEPGEELMPHRNRLIANPMEGPTQRTPIRKFTRNRGFVMQDDSAVVDESPEFAGTYVDAKKRRRFFDN
ncbi:Non-structural maintenance of [Carex littledalei]|uniref:Non-structural maintenance of n=1 Tax=Carex littledalei TaxID=544730 RepID=A0A833QMQ4_9POAL|nr:Non-structural maintenance of [Carex littledalei]